MDAKVKQIFHEWDCFFQCAKKNNKFARKIYVLGEAGEMGYSAFALIVSLDFGIFRSPLSLRLLRNSPAGVKTENK